MKLLRSLAGLAYLIVPALWMSSIPDSKLAPVLAAMVLVPGGLVAWLHWRQSDWKGQLRVFLGTILGVGVSISAWAMALLFLAFASDSGKYATQIGWLIFGVTVFFILVPTPLLAFLAAPRRPQAARDA